MNIMMSRLEERKVEDDHIGGETDPLQ